VPQLNGAAGGNRLVSMDRFVVRTPRPKQERPQPQKEVKWKQLVVTDLAVSPIDYDPQLMQCAQFLN